MFGLNYVVFRPHNVYGENQNIGDRYRNVIGIFMNQIMQGQPMTVFGDGLQTRAFSYIGDVAPQIASSVHVPEAFGEAINIGADKPYSVKYLAEAVAKVFDVEPNVRYLPARNEVVHAFSDHSKAARLFDQGPATELEEGLRRMAEWAIRVGARRSQDFGEIEVRQNLPPSWQD
jgi:UDP-glucose 4-epimerase